METIVKSAAEFLRFLVASNYLNLQNLQKSIVAVESYIAETQIGIDFYEKLKSDLKHYPGAAKYVFGNTYNTGETVLGVDGQLFVALQSTDLEPNSNSVQSQIWAFAAKFETPEYNSLFESFLGPLIAYKAVSFVAGLETFKLDGNGISYAMPEGAAVVDTGGIKAYFEMIVNNIELITTGMTSFVKIQKSKNNLFDLYKLNSKANQSKRNNSRQFRHLNLRD